VKIEGKNKEKAGRKKENEEDTKSQISSVFSMIIEFSKIDNGRK